MRLTHRQRLTRALDRLPVDRPPVWFMRQAGRYLPEYRKLRAEHGFLEVCHTPELAKRVTLQPVERFDLDAAIIFSDILVPLEAMGHPVTYEEGIGPVVEAPIRDPEQVDELVRPSPAEAYPALAEAVRAVRQALPDRGVLGFAGAPFTLATYLIEGGSPKRYEHLSRFRLDHPDAFERLMALLADVAGDQLAAQASAGADAVQLFDTHAETLALADYRDVALGPTQAALDHVAPDQAARIHFAKGTAHLLPALSELEVEALSVDWRTPLTTVAHHAPHAAVQGNLDPGLLYGPPDTVARRTDAVLREGCGLPGHVFNLGHGIHPKARLESVEAMVRTVQRFQVPETPVPEAR